MSLDTFIQSLRHRRLATARGTSHVQSELSRMSSLGRAEALRLLSVRVGRGLGLQTAETVVFLALSSGLSPAGERHMALVGAPQYSHLNAGFPSAALAPELDLFSVPGELEEFDRAVSDWRQTVQPSMTDAEQNGADTRLAALWQK